jgi:hypothetical protein
VLLESTLPLLVASLVAAGAGFGVGIPVVNALLPSAAHAAHPRPIYYLTMVAGLAISLAVIGLTLPLLGRITEPNNARFE